MTPPPPDDNHPNPEDPLKKPDNRGYMQVVDSCRPGATQRSDFLLWSFFGGGVWGASVSRLPQEVAGRWVYVTNLHPRTPWWVLKDRMKVAGDVVTADGQAAVALLVRANRLAAAPGVAVSQRSMVCGGPLPLGCPTSEHHLKLMDFDVCIMKLL